MHTFSRLCARTACAIILTGVFVAATGCGKSSAKVTGSVSYKGTPIKSGLITFMREEDGTLTNAQIINGTYTFDKFPAGKVRVAVNLPAVNPMTAKGREAATTKSAIEKVGERPKQAPPQYSMPRAQPDAELPALPEKFTNPNSSGVEYEVTPGQQTKNFDLG